VYRYTAKITPAVSPKLNQSGRRKNGTVENEFPVPMPDDTARLGGSDFSTELAIALKRLKNTQVIDTVTGKFVWVRN
jgi:hypothetical protein